MAQTVYCPHCGIGVVNDGTLSGQMTTCPSCSGVFQMPYLQAAPAASFVQEPEYHRDFYPHSPPKNSGIAAVLSFFWPGLGQIYNGEIGKGILLFLLTIVFAVLSFLLIGIPLLLVLWVWSMYDAYNVAETINRRRYQHRRY